jgi:putative ABC transport system permease protein
MSIDTRPEAAGLQTRPAHTIPRLVIVNGVGYDGGAPAPVGPSAGGLFAGAAVVWTKVRSSLVLATRSLWLHKLRSFLSVLGIIIGTAAVIALMAFGEGSMYDALEDIKRQGATNVIVRSLKPAEDTNSNRRSWIVAFGLTWGDFERIAMLQPAVKGLVPMRVFPQDVYRLERKAQGVRVVGTTEDYQRIHQFEMAGGRFLVDSEDQGGHEGDDHKIRNVVVLGAGVADELFPFEAPLGKTIVLNKHNYMVVGVMKPRMPMGTTASGEGQEEYDRDLYIPIRTCNARFGEKVIVRQSGARFGEQVQLHQITVTVADMSQVRDTGEAIRDLLERHHQKKDWTVTVPLDRLEEAERTRARFTWLMAMIAGISLVVGGIGIMNIMLATVTERTREIGVRRALGAKRRDITLQFLIEAVVQTGLGAVLGLVMALFIIYAVPPLAAGLFGATLPARLHVPSIFLALGVAVGVGVLFGWYPAQRASRLDPIEALRHV